MHKMVIKVAFHARVCVYMGGVLRRFFEVILVIKSLWVDKCKKRWLTFVIKWCFFYRGTFVQMCLVINISLNISIET